MTFWRLLAGNCPFSLRNSCSKNTVISRRWFTAQVGQIAQKPASSREFRQLASLIRKRQFANAAEFLEENSPFLKAKDFGKLLSTIRTIQDENIPMLGRMVYEHWEAASCDAAETQSKDAQETEFAMKHMLAQTLLSNNQLSEGEQLVRQLMLADPQHLLHYQTTLLQAYGKLRGKDSKVGLNRINQLVKEIPVDQYDAAIYCALIFAYASRRLFDRLGLLVQQMEGQHENGTLEFNQQVWAALIRAYSHHDFERAREYLDKMRADGFLWSDAVFRPLIDSAVQRKDLKSAFELVDLMQSKFIQPCHDTVAVLSKAIDYGLSDSDRQRLDQMVRAHLDITEDNWKDVMLLPEKPITDKLAIAMVGYLAQVKRPDLIPALHQKVVDQMLCTQPKNSVEYICHAAENANLEMFPQLVDFVVERTRTRADLTSSIRMFTVLFKNMEKRQSPHFENALKLWNTFVKSKAPVKQLKRIDGGLNANLVVAQTWPPVVYETAAKFYHEKEQNDLVNRLLLHLVKGIRAASRILRPSERRQLILDLEKLMPYNADLIRQAQNILKK